MTFSQTQSGSAMQTTPIIRTHNCHGCGEEHGVYNWRGNWYGDNCAEFYDLVEKDETWVADDHAHCAKEFRDGR